jgi:hypothetical protein
MGYVVKVERIAAYIIKNPSKKNHVPGMDAGPGGGSSGRISGGRGI